MQLERRALYNLLRMKWLEDRNLKAEPWQVEDYRALSFRDLFDRLSDLGVSLTRGSFHAYAESYDTPEDLCEAICPSDSKAEEEDEVYLLLFELWRRLLPEKLCLSIFCDELDYQISVYDAEEARLGEEIQDVLANLLNLLEEYVDEGVDPEQAFTLVTACCANDLESFLYDFIVDQIEAGNDTYAAELLDGFYPFVHGKLWFDFLRARHAGESDMVAANDMISEMEEELEARGVLELYLEILEFLVQGGERALFVRLATRAAQLLETEEDLQDLLAVCADFYRCLDHDREEKRLMEMLAQRASHSLEEAVNPQDPDLAQTLEMLNTSITSS